MRPATLVVRNPRYAQLAGPRCVILTPYLAVCSASAVDRDLQREVSSALGVLIRELLGRRPEVFAKRVLPPEEQEQKEREIDWLLINCSYAWVRWYDEVHKNDLLELRRMAEEQGCCEPIRENLDKWVGEPAFTL